jgi:hypothetical protein
MEVLDRYYFFIFREEEEMRKNSAQFNRNLVSPKKAGCSVTKAGKKECKPYKALNGKNKDKNEKIDGDKKGSKMAKAKPTAKKEEKNVEQRKIKKKSAAATKFRSSSNKKKEDLDNSRLKSDQENISAEKETANSIEDEIRNSELLQNDRVNNAQHQYKEDVVNEQNEALEKEKNKNISIEKGNGDQLKEKTTNGSEQSRVRTDDRRNKVFN